jgi:hypothetical protein
MLNPSLFGRRQHHLRKPGGLRLLRETELCTELLAPGKHHARVSPGLTRHAVNTRARLERRLDDRQLLLQRPALTWLAPDDLHAASLSD